MTAFLEHFRSELAGAGLARSPRDAGVAHPLWLEPRDGAIAPGEKENATENDDELVLSAYRVPGLSTGPYEGDTYRFDNVQLWIRATKPPQAYALEELIRPRLHDRRDFLLGSIDGGLRIIEALIFAELAPLGSSEQGYTFRIEYSLQRYVEP